MVAEARGNVADLADRPGPHQFHDTAALGVQLIHEGFHQKGRLPPSGFGHGHDFRMVDAEGFFAQYRLACLQGAQGPLDMPGVRGTDINGLHTGIVQQRGIAGMRPLGRNVELCRKRGGTLGVAAGHRHEPVFAGLLQCSTKCSADRARREHTPIQCHFGPFLRVLGPLYAEK